MVFSSPIFLFLFLPVLLGLYFLLRSECRNLLLLAASLLFYSWGEGRYIAVLLASIAANYSLGLLLDRFQGRRLGSVVMALTVVVNLGLLISFKYANFLADNLNVALAEIGWPTLDLKPVHLPLGISFFTFHALSYVMDIYRGEVRALGNPITFALYISFFPQSIAGPIVRYSEVAAQLVERQVTSDGFAWGARRFLIGLGKKMLVANTVARAADGVFAIPAADLTGRLAWLGAMAYTLQIYSDFSGYSDMALGLGRMFGFRFPENFRYPYAATSVTDFWRRWHISLSTWFRDYLYIPLGGSRSGSLRTYANLLIVFVLCGLWHGASWTFLLWGLYHGAFLVIERLGLGQGLARLWRPLGSAYTLLVVIVGWVFFRAATQAQALAMLTAMAGMGQGTGVEYHVSLYWNAELALVLIAGMVGALPFLPWLERTQERILARVGQPLAGFLEAGLAITQVAALGLLFLGSAMLLAAGTYNPFIYFRF
jgi:alginate O-acetyltransferase complex protein AlgI